MQGEVPDEARKFIGASIQKAGTMAEDRKAENKQGKAKGTAATARATSAVNPKS